MVMKETVSLSPNGSILNLNYLISLAFFKELPNFAVLLGFSAF